MTVGYPHGLLPGITDHSQARRRVKHGLVNHCAGSLLPTRTAQPVRLNPAISALGSDRDGCEDVLTEAKVRVADGIEVLIAASV